MERTNAVQSIFPTSFLVLFEKEAIIRVRYGWEGISPSRVVARLSLGRAGVSFSLLESDCNQILPNTVCLVFFE